MNTASRIDDRTLLRRYVEQNSQEAFAAIVDRHIGLVYSTCYRELRSRSLAEDISQTVFIILAQKAPRLSSRTVLAGWLFQTARFAARNARIREMRREKLEHEVMREKMNNAGDQRDSPWSDVEPFLGGALANLPRKDREVILLRYWDGLRLAQTAQELGISEDAAKKRVTRALEKLRLLLGRQGVVLGAGSLGAQLSLHAVKASGRFLAPAIARFTENTPAGHVNAALIQPSIHELSKGLLRAMRIAQIKSIAAITGAVALGSVTVGIVHGGIRPNPTIDLDTPTNGLFDQYAPGRPASKYRNVALKGMLAYEGGAPASGFMVAAMPDYQRGAWKAVAPTKPFQEISYNSAMTRTDGTFTLPVGYDVPYNVMVFDTTGNWVAQALQGVQGHKNATVPVAPLVLTRGAIVEGTVKDHLGRPWADHYVNAWNPARPFSSGHAATAKTDASGRYRIRVASGACRIYLSYGNRSDSEINVEVAPREVKVVDVAMK